MPGGSGGRPARIASFDCGTAPHPRYTTVITVTSRTGASSTRSNPTYGMFAPAAISIAQTLMGGATADRMPSMNTKAVVRASDRPMSRNTAATRPPTTSTETTPAPVSAPGISIRPASTRSSSHFRRCSRTTSARTSAFIAPTSE